MGDDFEKIYLDSCRERVEMAIKNWPSGWGDDLRILIYGDFEPPKQDLHFDNLGITVHSEKVEKTFIVAAGCVLEATVKIQVKSAPQLIEAARRINLLLGTWVLLELGNIPCGWWSYVTHGTRGGVLAPFGHERMQPICDSILKLPYSVRRKVEGALYWIREPKRLLREAHTGGEVFRVYSAYWNAFECLVDAVGLIRPQDRLKRSKKQEIIDGFLMERSGKLTVGDINDLYKTIVDPGFPGKASHALGICFGRKSDQYIKECFKAKNRNERLYDIRNAINHGDVDPENFEEWGRIEGKLHRLHEIVWKMFVHIISSYE